MRPELLSAPHERGMNLCSTCWWHPQVLWKSLALPGVFRLLFSTSDTSTSKIGFSKPPIECWGGAATAKREHSTGLNGCKQVCSVANLACFLKRYTIFSGFSPAISTTDCDSIGRPSCPVFAKSGLHYRNSVPSRSAIFCVLIFIRQTEIVAGAPHRCASSKNLGLRNSGPNFAGAPRPAPAAPR